MRFLWVIGAAAVLLLGCATPEPPRPDLGPYLVRNGQGVFLNTFTLGQGDFPVLSGLDALPGPPDWVLPDEAAVRELFAGRFRAAGFDPKPDFLFHYGRIDVRLDGYDPARHVGYLIVSREDYERPRPIPEGAEGDPGLFYTEASSDQVSMPELLALEQVNLAERAYVALVNLHQFAWKATEGEAGRTAMGRRLESRLDLYLLWLQARWAERGGERRPAEGRPAEGRPPEAGAAEGEAGP